MEFGGEEYKDSGDWGMELPKETRVFCSWKLWSPNVHGLQVLHLRAPVPQPLPPCLENTSEF